jgi:glycolate oxidase iron-sulfur subunit
MTRTPLNLNADDLNACVACGLCLPHCPTYRVTGREIASPRGRITAMRAVEWNAAPIDDAFRDAMEECVECRGCEAACPSGVPFGHLMEATRAALPPPRSPVRRAGEWFAYSLVLPRHWLLLALTRGLWVAQKLRLVPKRFGLPPISLQALELPAGGTPDAWLFTGCVMDAWQRETHRSAARVMQATGARVAVPRSGGDCCGALHVHAGRDTEARKLAARTLAAMPGAAPIVVDSAGCGAWLKEHSHRVVDFTEWLATQPPLSLRHTNTTVVMQDPCHLRHVQRAHVPVRTVLSGAYEVVETSDDGLCCGAGGAYSVLQPELSTKIRDRKVDALRSTSAGRSPIVASANPGCLMQLRGAGIDARHPADLLAEALDDG